MKFEKKILSSHMIFASFDKCNPYQNRKENLAFATRAQQHSKKKYQKSNFHFFKNCRGSKSETTASQRLRIIEDVSNS